MAEGQDQDDAQKTEEPTPKKLEDARKKGNVPMSKEVNNWMMIFAGTFLLAGLSSGVLTDLSNLLEKFIAGAHDFPSAPGGMHVVLGGTVQEVLTILSLPLIVLIFIAFMAPFAQIGPLFAPDKIKPDISKVSPVKGFTRLFSMNSLMEFGKGVLKLALISIVGVAILYPYYDNLGQLIDTPLGLALDEIKGLIVRLLIGVLIVIFVVAMIDLVFQRYEHYKKMRMTRQEVKDEHKQSEGDPHVKAKLRQLRSEKARQRMMQAVPEADVVITNPTHFSIALKYDPEEMDAPLCVAKGMDELALRIREVAKEHNITLYENKPLARALYDTVEVDETIPAEHFKAVAEVISYVFKLKGKLK